MRILRIVLGVVVGYGVMVLFITLVQETWFGGVDYYTSSRLDLGVAGFFTALSAVAGGAAGTTIAGSKGRVVAKIMSLEIVVEMTILTASGQLTGPLWFEWIAAASLIVGIIAGAEIVRRLPRRAVHAPA